jgi:hypothetical protein
MNGLVCCMEEHIHVLRLSKTFESEGAPSSAPKDSFILDPKAPRSSSRPATATPRRVGLAPDYNSSGNSRSSANENTGPSTHTYFGPTLQRPQMPMPHFMRFSSVV